MSDKKRRSLLDILIRAFGGNPTQVRWRWRQRWQRFRSRKKDTGGGKGFEHKLCHVCSAPVDRDETTCNRCGTTLSGATVTKARRALGEGANAGGRVYTTLIGLTILMLFGVMLAKGGMGMLFPSSGGDAFRMNHLGIQLGASHVFYYDLPRLTAWLGQYGLATSAPELPHVHRLVTSMFVHFGLLHIAFNAYALFQLGPLLEEIYGRSKFLFIYLVSGIGASAASLWYHWDKPVFAAGASGALFGMIGASLIYGYAHRQTSYGRGLLSEMLKWGIFALLLGLVVPQVDNAAHIGGALTGAFVATFLSDRHSPSRIPGGFWLFVEVVCVLVIIASFVALFAVNDPVLQGLAKEVKRA